MNEKIYLGVDYSSQNIWIEKHKWECDWYWAFGYLGNRNCHFHIESLIRHPDNYHPDWTNVTQHFRETWITQDQWWIIRDLFIQAYAIKKCAETYRYGGHQTDKAKPYRIESAKVASLLNRDLGKLLDNIWGYLKSIEPQGE